MTNPSPSLPADLGRHVVLDLITGEGPEHLELDIVPDEQADFRLGLLGVGTPLAIAILGRRAGQTVPYRTGGTKEIRIISVSTPTSAPSEDVASRRQETIRRALDQADRTNAMIFASSFSGKWGDYDPTGFEIPGSEENPDKPPEDEHEPPG